MVAPKTNIHGVGINDADYPCSGKNWVTQEGKHGKCPFYRKWCHMLDRVYDPIHISKFPHCKGNSIQDEWLYFSNFRKWMSSQVYEGLHLDKDILVQGNKHYSESTCALIPNYLNLLFVDGFANRGSYPLGVWKGTPKNERSPDRFVAQCGTGHNKGRIYLGSYKSPMEAHSKWQEQKIVQIEYSILRFRKESCYRKDIETSLDMRINQLKFESAVGIETTFL